ncbi:glutathione synthase [Melanogaster broomeanus]|nr:glutathione synthase [Melanogaster broomeanus]
MCQLLERAAKDYGDVEEPNLSIPFKTFDFSKWPPSLTDTQLETLTYHATTYALSHGLTYLPLAPTQPPSPTSAIHAPISLLPIPRSLFEKAQGLQSVYNTLYARVATNNEFLDQEMGAELGVGKADEFVRTLWKGWKEIREEGIIQPLHLGLFRSDYLLHTGGGEGRTLGVKQVEFNTISSSFGPLSERAAAMHRYLHELTDYYSISPDLKPENFPSNNTTSGLAEGLSEAHKAYGVQGAYILFVVQPNERNVFDQRWLEYELLEKHSIRVVRQTFVELSSSATLDPQTRISTVYFRAGYVPTDFPTEEHFKTRFTLERSRAIKCPTIPLQLAGGKKVQEVLSQPSIVEKFFTSPSGVDTSNDAADLRETWMPAWHDARAHSLVLKPQREGGGNNVYKDDIPAFLDTLAPEERQAWIAMELIVPPAGVGGYLVRAGGANGGGDAGAVRAETVSELGVFGWALFGKEGIVKERGEGVGWLMRTKGVESNEGDVAAGFSVLDLVVLVDG